MKQLHFIEITSYFLFLTFIYPAGKIHMPHEDTVVEDRQVVSRFHRQATLIESVDRWFVLFADCSMAIRREPLDSVGFMGQQKC